MLTKSVMVAKGVLGVDMESTALMVTAELLGVHLIVVLAISDELYHPVWRGGFKSKKLHDTERVLAKTSIQTLSTIVE